MNDRTQERQGRAAPQLDRKKTLFSRLFAGAPPVCMLVVCAAGLIVRFSVKDRVLGLDTFYYATPPVVLMGLSGLAGLWWLAQRRWKPALPALLLAALCLVWWTRTSWFHNPPAPPGDGLRVMFWNVAGGGQGLHRVVRRIREYDPDIIGLVEAGRRKEDIERVWSAHFPEYEIAARDLGVVLMVRGKLRTFHGIGLLAGDAYRAYGLYVHGEVELRGRRFRVVVVDISTYPFKSRSVALKGLYSLLNPLVGQPLLVIGDFNTPIDSVHLEPMRAHCSNAFELAGRGLYATWPMPLPVLALDQAWFAGGLMVERCELGWTWLSDHRPIRLELSFAP